MAPLIAAAFAAVTAAEKAYTLISTNLGIIGPVVLMIEKVAEQSKIPGVQKAAIALEALQAQIPELQNMTPEIKTAFNAAVAIVKGVQKAAAAVQDAAGTAAVATS
jgi:hypothetical protein